MLVIFIDTDEYKKLNVVDQEKLTESYTGGGRLLSSVIGYSFTIRSLANLKPAKKINLNNKSFMIDDIAEIFRMESGGQIEQVIQVFLSKNQ